MWAYVADGVHVRFSWKHNHKQCTEWRTQGAGEPHTVILSNILSIGRAIINICHQVQKHQE